MTSREKVVEVERQVRAMVAGDQEATFSCPYCGLVSDEFNELLCCDEAAAVVNAVLDHIEHLERAETVERAMENLARVNGSALVMN